MKRGAKGLGGRSGFGDGVGAVEESCEGELSGACGARWAGLGCGEALGDWECWGSVGGMVWVFSDGVLQWRRVRSEGAGVVSRCPRLAESVMFSK